MISDLESIPRKSLMLKDSKWWITNQKGSTWGPFNTYLDARTRCRLMVKARHGAMKWRKSEENM